MRPADSALVLSVSSSSWCLERAEVCDCGTPWTFYLPLFIYFSFFFLWGWGSGVEGGVLGIRNGSIVLVFEM